MLKIHQVHCVFTSLLASTIFATAFLMLRMFDRCYSWRSHSHPRNRVFYRICGLQRNIFVKKPGFSPPVDPIAPPPENPVFYPSLLLATIYFREKARFLATRRSDRTPTLETGFFTESAGCN